MEWMINTIAIMHSPCKEKFAVPRQSGLAPSLLGQIEILSPYDQDEAFLALDGFSHIWVLGMFHLAQTVTQVDSENEAVRSKWQPTVRPPRLGGNKRVGVFASRSPYRPNPVSLSVFKLVAITRRAGKLYLDVTGTDLVDGTPIIDIKPYLPYADSVTDAQAGYVDLIPKPQLDVEFHPKAEEQCLSVVIDEPTAVENLNVEQLKCLITELIQLDPRPAYKAGHTQREFGLSVFGLNVRFAVTDQTATVLSVSIDQ